MRSPRLVMERLDTSRWRLGSLFALLACNGDLGGDVGMLAEGECRIHDDCEADEYCDDGCCENDDDDDYDPCQDACDPECAEDSECGAGNVCYQGYCEDAEEVAEQICARQHRLSPKASDFIEVDGVVDLAFANGRVAIAYADRIDMVELDQVIASVEVGEENAAVGVSDIDGDDDEDVIVVDRAQGGRLLVLMTTDDGTLMETAEIASPGALDVELREREAQMPDALVRTDVALVLHVALGEATLLVEGPITQFAVHEDAVVYAADGTWWLDLSAAESAPRRLDDRTAVAVGWGGITANTTSAVGAFADPPGIRAWSDPDMLSLDLETDAVYRSFRMTDLVGDGIDDLIAMTDDRFVVVGNEPAHSLACTWGIPDATPPRRLIEVRDIDADGYVDVAWSDGRVFLVWTPDEALD